MGGGLCWARHLPNACDALLTLGSPASGLEAPLNAVLPRPVELADVAGALAAAARRDWPGEWRELDPARVLDRAAGHLSFFGSDEWTWRR